MVSAIDSEIVLRLRVFFFVDVGSVDTSFVVSLCDTSSKVSIGTIFVLSVVCIAAVVVGSIVVVVGSVVVVVGSIVVVVVLAVVASVVFVLSFLVG